MERTTMVRAIGYTAFLCAVWLLAASWRPTATYHLAPLLAAGAAPAVGALAGANIGWPRLSGLAIGSTALTIVVSLAASGLGWLAGPSLLPAGGALAESLVFAVVGGLAGLAFAVTRQPDADLNSS